MTIKEVEVIKPIVEAIKPIVETIKPVVDPVRVQELLKPESIKNMIDYCTGESKLLYGKHKQKMIDLADTLQFLQEKLNEKIPRL